MSDTPAQLIARIERDLAALKAAITGKTYAPPVTGWRLVRGTHAINYVPDPEGHDVPPDGYGPSPALASDE